MKNRYDEVMDKIEVTDEMRNRILRNLRSVEPEQRPRSRVLRFPSVRKFLSVAACLAICLAAALTLPGIPNPAPPGNEVLTPGADIAELATPEELSDAVGFEVSDITGLPFEAQEITYRAFWGELAEIEYRGEGQTAVFRKSPGLDDNSGDHNEYPKTREITADAFTVTLKGRSGSYVLATWHDDRYSYSLNITNGLTAAEWERLAAEISR